MLRYLGRRLIGTLLTLFLLATLTFFALRLAPGGPFDSDRVFPPEVKANILARYGLDRPLSAQFTGWLGDLARGDLRESFEYLGRPVAEIIGSSLPASAALGAGALLVALALGIPLGALSAWKRGGWLDHSTLFLTLSGLSLPSYLMASLPALTWFRFLVWTVIGVIVYAFYGYRRSPLHTPSPTP